MTVQPPPPPSWPAAAPAASGAPVGPPAGFWIRLVAFLIDGLILSAAAGLVIGIIVGIVVLSVGASEGDEAAGPIATGIVCGVLIMIVGGWLYEALMTSSARGATIGKMAVGVRIVRADGANLSFGRATARHFLKTLITPLVPLAIGYLLAAFTSGKRALHDFMADTFVIKSR